jgi:hypothetical protein
MTGELRPAVARAPRAPVDLSALESGTHLIALYHGEAELARIAAASSALAWRPATAYLPGQGPAAVRGPGLPGSQHSGRRGRDRRRAAPGGGFGELYGEAGSPDPAAASSGVRDRGFGGIKAPVHG